MLRLGASVLAPGVASIDAGGVVAARTRHQTNNTKRANKQRDAEGIC